MLFALEHDLPSVEVGMSTALSFPVFHFRSNIWALVLIQYSIFNILK